MTAKSVHYQATGILTLSVLLVQIEGQLVYHLSSFTSYFSGIVSTSSINQPMGIWDSNRDFEQIPITYNPH